MSARYLNPPGLRPPIADGSSQIGVAGPYERIALLAGQSGHDRQGKLSASFADQFAQALDNVAVALAHLGSCTEDVMRLQILIADYREETPSEVGRQLKARWPVLGPAITLIPVPRLAVDGMLVEVEATATLGSG